MNNDTNLPASEDKQAPNDAAGLLFSGKLKIIDAETGEVLVEQRSE
jgi:hypothetical protein